MSDVFISYSKVDKAIAEALAADLRARGLDVWWDIELYAGQDFHDAILEALDASTAVIVIWSRTAVKSRWVRGEASRACRAKKLIATHTPKFDLQHLPLNMAEIQCVAVTDRAQIFRALGKLGIKSASKAHSQPPGFSASDQELLRRAAPPYAKLDFSKQLSEIEEQSERWANVPQVLDTLARLHTLIASEKYTSAITQRILYLVVTVFRHLGHDDLSSTRTKEMAMLMHDIHLRLPERRVRKSH